MIGCALTAQVIKKVNTIKTEETEKQKNEEIIPFLKRIGTFMEERSNGMVKENSTKLAIGRPSVNQMHISAGQKRKITLIIIIITKG